MKQNYLLLTLLLLLRVIHAPIVLSQKTALSNVIAFVSEEDGDTEIYTIHSDGSNLRQLTHNSDYDDFPAWSPDGSQIVYVHEFDLYIMDADGTDSTRLPNIFGATLPSWSPDGNWIVFEQERDINALEFTDRHNSESYKHPG